MSDRHEERAKTLLNSWEHRPRTPEEKHADLAEQFREVGKLAVVATLAECERQHAEEIRAIVRAGDALREFLELEAIYCKGSAEDHSDCKGCQLLLAWDEATKEIER